MEERLHSSLARSSVGPESHWVRLAIYRTEKLDMNRLRKEDGRHIFVVCKLWLRTCTFLVCEGGGGGLGVYGLKPKKYGSLNLFRTDPRKKVLRTA